MTISSFMINYIFLSKIAVNSEKSLKMLIILKKLR